MRVWSFGGASSGSSSEQVVTSISPGAALDWNVSGVPQRGQKDRVPWAEDRKTAVSPATNRNAVTGTVSHATKGAPLVRRQIEQWHPVSSEMGPSIAYRTEPQQQPPFMPPHNR